MSPAECDTERQGTVQNSTFPNGRSLGYLEPFKDKDYPELYIFSLYCAVNTLHLSYKNQSANAV